LATVPFNLLLCLFVGLCFAACARTQLESGALPWRSDLLGLVLQFSLLCVAPVATYLYLVYPEWSWMYLVDPARLPLGTGLAVLILTVLAVPVGYLLGWLLLRLLGGRALFLVLGALGMGMGFMLVLLRRRFFYLGRFEDFRSSHPLLKLGSVLRPISQGKLLYALLCIAPLVLVSAFLVARALWVQGRWLRQQAASSLRTGEHRTAPSAPGKPLRSGIRRP
jgi:hypothetical protein